MVDATGHDRLARWWAALGWTAALFTLGCCVAWRNEPFDGSKAGTVGADQFGYTVHAFETRGWWAARMKPSALFLPEPGSLYVPYLHHPFVPYSIAAAGFAGLGGSEAAIRWPFVAALALAIAGLARVASWAGGARTAGLAVALFAVQPVVVQYGSMVDSFPLATASMLWAADAWFRGSGPGWRYGWWAFACGLLGWYGYLLVIALWLDLAWVRPRQPKRLRAAFLVGLPFGLALLTNLAWMTWAVGGWSAMVREARWLLGTFGGADLPHRHPAGFDTPYFANIGRFLAEGATGPLLAAGLVGLAVALVMRVRGRARAIDRVAVVIAVAGLLPSAAFWSRACLHEFFVLIAAPGLALLAARGLSTAADAALRFAPGESLGGRRALAGAALLILLGFSAWRGLQLHDHYRQDRARPLAAALDAAFAPGDVVFLAIGDGPPGIRFYSRTTVLPGVTSQAAFDWILGLLRPGRDHVRRLWFAAPQEALDTLPFVAGLPLRKETGRTISVGDHQILAAQLDPALLGP